MYFRKWGRKTKSLRRPDLHNSKNLSKASAIGRNKKIQIFEFYYGRFVPCCYGQVKRLGQILR